MRSTNLFSVCAPLELGCYRVANSSCLRHRPYGFGRCGLLPITWIPGFNRPLRQLSQVGVGAPHRPRYREKVAQGIQVMPEREVYSLKYQCCLQRLFGSLLSKRTGVARGCLIGYQEALCNLEILCRETKPAVSFVNKFRVVHKQPSLRGVLNATRFPRGARDDRLPRESLPLCPCKPADLPRPGGSR